MCVCGVRHVYLGFEWIYGTPLLRIIIVLQIKKENQWVQLFMIYAFCEYVVNTLCLKYCILSSLASIPDGISRFNKQTDNSTLVNITIRGGSRL